jgi:membrane-bound lytic murein transglycosylase B
MNRQARRLVLLAALLLGAPGALVALDADERAFVDEMVRKHGYDRAALTGLLEDAQFQEGIIALISKPAESKPWYEYRAIMLTPERIEQGVEFWQRNLDTLRRAEADYGVPPEIVTAILGVETRYGRNTGRHRVLDALVTLAFGYPKRAPFFRKELEQFLLMVREEGLDARSLNGSYAGAMGRSQFMPSSFRAYAVDFDGDGRRDLWGSDADAIGSIANYFVRNGWRPGERVVLPASGVDERHRRFLDAGLKPTLTLGELAAAGIRVTADGLPPDTPSSLFDLDEEDGPAYWAGLQNFYAITRYNRSELYAMAVYQLSREIARSFAERERKSVAR